MSGKCAAVKNHLLKSDNRIICRNPLESWVISFCRMLKYTIVEILQSIWVVLFWGCENITLYVLWVFLSPCVINGKSRNPHDCKIFQPFGSYQVLGG